MRLLQRLPKNVNASLWFISFPIRTFSRSNFLSYLDMTREELSPPSMIDGDAKFR